MCCPQSLTANSCSQKVSGLDRAVGRVWEALPEQLALLIVATGQGDTAEMRWQHELRDQVRQGDSMGKPPACRKGNMQTCTLRMQWQSCID